MSKFLIFSSLGRKRVAILNDIHNLNTQLKNPLSFDPANGTVKMSQFRVAIAKDVVLSYAKDQGMEGLLLAMDHN